MKKCVVGIFFALVLCLAMLPISAFAVEKTAITNVDELLQFAKAVDNGEYDGIWKWTFGALSELW